MINKKVSKIIGPVAGVMGFMIAMGAVSVPVYAAETIVSQSADSNYEINQNGVKFKVTNIIGTKNRVKINAIIERKDGISDIDHRNLQFNIYMENSEEGPSSMSWGTYGDQNKIKIEADNESEDGFSEKGNIRADVVMGEYDFNGSLVIPVDFTESFKQVMEKDLNAKVNDDIKIVKFESDAIGTRLIVDEPLDENGFVRSYYVDSMNYIIKVDDRIYKIMSMGHSYDDSNNQIYETEDLKYNDIKDAGKISIIPLKCTMTDEERENYYKNISEDFVNSKVTSDNVVYNNEILFTDGTKGEIKAERAEHKIKLYCSSDSDKKSMLMATGLTGIYTDKEEYFDELGCSTVYKDKDNEHQYVVEFNDTNNDKTTEVFLHGLISNIDKFELGDEITVK